MILDNDLLAALKNVVIIGTGIYATIIVIGDVKKYIRRRRLGNGNKTPARSLHLENAYERMNRHGLLIEYIPIDIDENGVTFEISTKCDSPVLIATILITWSQLDKIAPLK